MKKMITAFAIFIGVNLVLTISLLQSNSIQNSFDEDTRQAVFNYWQKDNLQNRNQLLAKLRVRDQKTYKNLITWNTDWNRNQANLFNQYQLFSDKLFNLYFLSQKMNWSILEKASFKLLKEVSGRSFRQASNFDRYKNRLSSIKKLSTEVVSNNLISKMEKTLGSIQAAMEEQQRLENIKGHFNPQLLKASINKQTTLPWTGIIAMVGFQILFAAVFIGLAYSATEQEQILDAQGTEASKESLPIEDINLTEIIENVLSDLSPIFQSKNLQVIFHSSEEYIVQENKERLSRTLNSLILDIALAVAPRSTDKTLMLQILKQNDSVILNTKIKDICLSQAVLFDPYTGNESNAGCLEESLEAFEKTTSGTVSVKNHYDPVNKSLFSNIDLSFRA